MINKRNNRCYKLKMILLILFWK